MHFMVSVISAGITALGEIFALYTDRDTSYFEGHAVVPTAYFVGGVGVVLIAGSIALGLASVWKAGGAEAH